MQALFQEFKSLSYDEDSGAEQVTTSISKPPKPSLNPFFSSSRSFLDNNQPTSLNTDNFGAKQNCSSTNWFTATLEK